MAIKHHCGLFGIFGHPDAVNLTYYGLFAQQHRGQEAAGIVSADGHHLRRHAGPGLVTEVFDERTLESLRNPIAIGHLRYSTTGSNTEQNIQPLLVHHRHIGPVALGHNGNLVNAALLRSQYEEFGHIFQTTSDTEVIIHLLAKPTHHVKQDALTHVLNHLQGAYSLLFLFPDRIVAVRDPYGIRPLCVGRMQEGAYVVASETCALDIVGAAYLRDVEPGELVTLSADGLTSKYFVEPGTIRPAHCIFEHVYFADPSSNVFGENVHMARVAMGRQLAREAPSDADLVIDVPNSGRCAAIGYHEESRIPLGRGFTTSNYAGRSFIMPHQRQRDLAVRMKLNVIREAVAGKRIVVVEDSVVRGTTTRGKMGSLRKAGAKEIHLRVTSPPIRHACYYGIDFPDPQKLIATGREVDQIAEFLGVDSLRYLSVEGMLSAVRPPNEHFCTACFTNRYPIPVDHPVSKFELERTQLRMFE
jgi:amidophosphoribosyltransferase